ncbi:V-set and transmembrane domain-containing protein 2-like [Crotalus adamanteus]|uniref:V-set and transmembrane domain-containing protein 2-like n=1 Tax=Crotalus adamanteus TaxID=8729 RepID=A0AAW1BTF0_CROAD
MTLAHSLNKRTSQPPERQWGALPHPLRLWGREAVASGRVVKVAGSNISHKLRLSRVKPADEGTYECRVIDFSDRPARHHKVKAYLRVEAEDSAPSAHGRPLQDTQLLLLATGQTPERGRPAAPRPPHPPRLAKELKKRSLDEAPACAR